VIGERAGGCAQMSQRMARAALLQPTSCLSCLTSSRVKTADDSIVISVNEEDIVARELQVWLPQLFLVRFIITETPPIR
jgi:hypothetical protein